MRYKKREKKERDSQKERDEQRERDRQRKREIEKQDIKKKNEIEKHRCKERKLKGSDIDKCRDLEVWGRMKQCLMFIQARMESLNSRPKHNMIKHNIH